MRLSLDLKMKEATGCSRPIASRFDQGGAPSVERRPLTKRAGEGSTCTQLILPHRLCHPILRKPVQFRFDNQPRASQILRMVETNSTMLPLGTRAPDFRLKDTIGKAVSLSVRPVSAIFNDNVATRENKLTGLSILGTWSELFGKLVVDGFDRTPETGRIRAGDGFAVQELRDSRLEVLEVVGIRGKLEVVNGPPV